MIFYGKSLIGIQTLTGGIDRIVRLYLRDDLRGVVKAEPLEINHPLFVQPTTGDMMGDEFHYIANSQLRSFDEKGMIFPMEKLQDPVILKIDLLDSERAELLQVHENGRNAHMKADAHLLLQDSPDEFITVGSGKIGRVTRNQEQEMFNSYFEGAKYSEYSDLEPPIVHVSNDGNSGWLITRIRSRRTQAGKEQEFVYAGIMTYEKRDGKWIRSANVSTFEPQG